MGLVQGFEGLGKEGFYNNTSLVQRFSVKRVSIKALFGSEGLGKKRVSVNTLFGSEGFGFEPTP